LFEPQKLNDGEAHTRVKALKIVSYKKNVLFYIEVNTINTIKFCFVLLSEKY